MVESVVLSDRSRTLLRCIVEACEATGGDRASSGAVDLPVAGHAGCASWPCAVAPPTRRELTPLRMQGLVVVRTAEDALTVSPTALGVEVAGRLAPAAPHADEDATVARRIVERVAELVEAEPDAETRARLRAAWSVLHATVDRAALEVAPERRGPRARVAARARALRRRPTDRAGA